MYVSEISNLLARFDTWSFTFLHQFHSEFLIRYMVYITDFCGPGLIAVYSAVLLLVLWLHKKNHHLLQFLFTLLSGSIVVVIMKYWYKIPRPPRPLIPETGYSFASAHAALSFIFFMLIAHSYKSHIKNKYVRTLFVSLCICTILLVGVSRVYLGVHYASDVVAGFAVGAIIYAISILIFG